MRMGSRKFCLILSLKIIVLLSPKRLIFDNTLVFYEVVHTTNARKKEKEGYMALKLDMNKAYNMVE
jgi:hypothetical protein